MVTQNVLRTHEGVYVFSKKKLRFVSALDLFKCLKQNKLLLTCPLISELPSNIRTKIIKE